MEPNELFYIFANKNNIEEHEATFNLEIWRTL